MVLRSRFEIAESKRRIFTRDLYRCQYPGCRATGEGQIEVAHRIAQTSSNEKDIRQWLRDEIGTDWTLAMVRKKIIHHRLNMVTSCRRHNDYFNIGFNRLKMMELVRRIYDDVKEGL